MPMFIMVLAETILLASFQAIVDLRPRLKNYWPLCYLFCRKSALVFLGRLCHLSLPIAISLALFVIKFTSKFKQCTSELQFNRSLSLPDFFFWSCVLVKHSKGATPKTKACEDMLMHCPLS